MKCQYCNTRYNKKLNGCPSCGAPIAYAEPEAQELRQQQNQRQNVIIKLANNTRKKKKIPTWITVLAVIGFFMVVGLIRRGVEEAEYKQWKEDRRTDYADPASAPYSQMELPGTTRHNLGAAGTLDKVDYTLLAVVESHGTKYNQPEDGNIYLLFEIEMFNGTEEDFYIYSGDVQAYLDDYVLEDSYGALDAVEYRFHLSGDVGAGKYTKGFIGYEVPKDWQTIELMFESEDYRNREKLIFTLRQDDMQNPGVEARIP